MKKFIVSPEFAEIFPEFRIGVLVCRGIDNHIREEDRYAGWLAEAQEAAGQYIREETFTDNPVVRSWREAFSKFKTKKGARCSIEALLKRVSKGNSIGCINPLVDLYNGISLKYGLPAGGEDIDRFRGDLQLTLAEGGEEFITYGSDKSEPPYPAEVVYKDDAGAVCRCFNWRESVRTMLTEDTVNAFMCLETVDGARPEALDAALDELAEKIRGELGGVVKKYILTANFPSVTIEEQEAQNG